MTDPTSASRSAADEESELAEAIRLSLQEATTSRGPQCTTDDEEEDIQRAIQLSLQGDIQAGSSGNAPPASSPPTPHWGNAPTLSPESEAVGSCPVGVSSALPFVQPRGSSKSPTDLLVTVDKLEAYYRDSQEVGGAACRSPHPTRKRQKTVESAASPEESDASGPEGPSEGEWWKDAGMSPLSSEEMTTWTHILFGANPKAEDVQRWHKQCFEFSKDCRNEWGLCQRSGGPCGVLASLQCWILQVLLFEWGLGVHANDDDVGDNFSPVKGTSMETRWDALVSAIGIVLYQCTPTSSYSIVVVDSNVPPPGQQRNAWVIEFECLANVMSFLLATPAVLKSATAVISFVYSVLRTRGIPRLQVDMDEWGSPIIGAFGHCSQELVNLLLTGEATTNVFDSEKALADGGIVFKGVYKQVAVGFLSEVEAMRYCEVGLNYKHPHFPLWVLGSPDHYTIVFATDPKVSLVSPSERVRQEATQAFRKFDHEQNGFIPVGHLPALLEAVALSGSISEGRSSLDSPRGGGLILWNDFWNFVRWKKLDGGGQCESVSCPPSRLVVSHYDGQDPPGPTCRRFLVELSDIDAALAQPDRLERSFQAALATRWGGCIVSEILAPYSTDREPSAPPGTRDSLTSAPSSAPGVANARFADRQWGA